MRVWNYKEMYARGQVLSLGIHFFVNMAILGSRISESLQPINLKLHRLTKFGTTNWFMEMNFCFHEKQKISQFWITSWKRSIFIVLTSETFIWKLQGEL